MMQMMKMRIKDENNYLPPFLAQSKSKRWYQRLQRLFSPSVREASSVKPALHSIYSTCPP